VKRFAGVVLGLGVIAAACALGRAEAGAPVDAATAGMVVLGALVVGGVWGARVARARRGWADYQYTRRQVPITRRAFTGQAKQVATFVLVLAVAVWFALYLAGQR
jgi:hypothetical protein